MNAANRLSELDALRGLAALAVVLYHYVFRYDEIYGHSGIATAWIEPGKYGVELFFMISGFVIFWTLNRVRKPMDFVASRFSRLYPVFWAAILLTFICVSSFGLPGRESSFDQALLNGLMFHSYFGVAHVDGVYWTLTVELTFYFWMFVIYWAGQLPRAQLVLSLVMLAYAVCQALSWQWEGNVTKLLIAKYLPFFCLGITFYQVYTQGKHWSQAWYAGVALFCIALIYDVQTLALSGLLCMAFLLVALKRLSFLQFKPLVYLGSISYSLYLLHQNLGYIVINKGYEANLPPVLSIVLALAVSMFLAAMLTLWIEQPCQRWIKRFYQNSVFLQNLNLGARLRLSLRPLKS